MAPTVCNICLRSFSLTSAGLVRTHGPVNSRCPGSQQQPGRQSTSTLTPSTSSGSPPSSFPTSSSPGILDDPLGFSMPPLHGVKILKRIPRGSREQALGKLGGILEGVIGNNTLSSWERLFRFTGRCLRVPTRGGRRWSLATMVNKQLREEEDAPAVKIHHGGKGKKRGGASPDDLLVALGKRVSVKLEEGDFKGAVRLACSEDTMAERNEATYMSLQGKHPPAHPDSSIPSPPVVTPNSITVTVEDVVRAIRSFPNGSAGGPDGLRPQHLKDMLNTSNGEESSFLSALAAFSTLVLEGRVPPPVRPFFFGANLVALGKKGGGVRPIAVGCSLRRLVAKIAGNMVVEEMASLLSPRQLGYGIRGGAEAAVHATRQYLNNLEPDHAVVKLDFKNAFNSVRRDKMLDAVQVLAPKIYPFVHCVYSSPSSLFWGERSLQSSEGVQQGDPLGPLLFCLSLHRPCLDLSSEFCVMYLDDVTLGGTTAGITHDLGVIKSMEEIGLVLNNQKSEIICGDPVSKGTILSSLPGARVVDPSDADLLGSPLGNVNSISASLQGKIDSLQVMGDRLQHFSAHDALLLLRNSFSIPKLLYTLRTSPSFLSPALATYDESLKSIVSSITNINFADGDPAWLQASLPVGVGGLGLRSAVQLAPSAFLASAAASSDLIKCILPTSLRSLPIPHVEDAMSAWSEGHDNPPPSGNLSFIQKSWDACKVATSVDSLLEHAPDDMARARLLAVSTKESGAWLQALPITSLGLRMDDETIRVAVGLRLGSTLCRSHTCQHCGAEVDRLATHGLSCKKSSGRHQRHAAINDIVHRALSSAHIPSRLEPSGLHRSDGKRPDGVTMIPWKCGKPLVWDATCPDTLALSYRGAACSGAGAVAAMAEERKVSKYANLDTSHTFTPVAVETMGVIGTKSMAFLKDLGHRIRQRTGEAKASAYLLQRVSVAVQRGNAISILGSVGGLWSDVMG